MQNEKKIFDQLLNVYFLRPEIAFTVFRRMASIYESGFHFDKGPSIDISCGDGLFAFILAGGKLNDGFDVFVDIEESAIGLLCKNKKTDIHDSLNNSIIVDPLKSPPHYQIDYGTDWKKNMLQKARRLRLYKSLLLHDNNKPFPFKDASFNRVYSNSTYWVKDIILHLKEIYRIIKPEGEILLQIKTQDFLAYNPLNWKTPWLSMESKRILDRGRLETWKGMRSIEWWLATLKKTGFRIKTIKPVYSKEQIIMWNIGLRPIAHFLVLLFNRLDPKTRTEIKRDFISYIRPLVIDIANIKPKEKNNLEFSLLLKR